MNTYIKINSINYPAEIYGHVRDRDWDNRESKVIILPLTIEEALALFTDNVQWSIVYGTQTIPQDEFIIAGPITDNRNGTVSVRMGKPTAAEVSNIITGGAVDLPTAYTMRAVIEDSVTALDDETAATAPSLFKVWAPGEAVVPGDRRYYPPTGLLYKVREGQGHTTQERWTPDLTPALWAVVGDPGEAGTLDGNTWSPDAYPQGWEDLGEVTA